MKKFVVSTLVVGLGFTAFAASAFGAQPDNPGCVGAAVSGQAHEWGGRGEVVSGIAKTGAYGEGVQAYLASNPCGH